MSSSSDKISSVPWFASRRRRNKSALLASPSCGRALASATIAYKCFSSCVKARRISLVRFGINQEGNENTHSGVAALINMPLSASRSALSSDPDHDEHDQEQAGRDCLSVSAQYSAARRRRCRGDSRSTTYPISRCPQWRACTLNAEAHDTCAKDIRPASEHP